MSNARNIIVSNDEAHHAWRMNPEAVGKYKRTGSDKDSVKKPPFGLVVWIKYIAKRHIKCFDLTATPLHHQERKPQKMLYLLG